VTPAALPAALAAAAVARAAPAEAGARARIVPVRGGAGAPLAEVAAGCAARAGVDTIRPGAGVGRPDLAQVLTAAWLRGHAVYLPVELLSDRSGHAEAIESVPLPGLPVVVFVGLHDRAALRGLGAAASPPIEVPPLSHGERLEHWRCAVPSSAGTPILAEVARRFRYEQGPIARVGAELAALGRVPTADEVLAAARADLDLGTLAQPVAPRFRLGELMLPPAQARQIDEIATAMNNLTRVHYEWGTARAWNEGGLAALFAGPPGTGKTMAAEAIADALALPLYRIDLSQVVNKYIGETEKNLRRLFDAADAADVVLFFDEADALFGKRTEVKDAHDRYANLEISYLLERMERFKGLAVLATNRKKDLDEAFLRRLRFVVEFPLPGVAERLRIWRSVIPAGVDASGLDLEFLAQRFALAGGHIRAIVFQACLQSAAEGAPRRLTMPAVVRAVQREYAKLDRASSLDQFGPYAALVAEERATR
jgi:vesicle-fusing ATPase